MAKITIPELGTRAAALDGYVNLISRVCREPQHVIELWLDTYYQLRLAYEADRFQARIHGAERDARRLEAFRQGMRRMEKEGEAPEAEQAATAPDVSAEAEASAPEAQAAEEPAETKKDEEQVAERSVTPPPTEGSGTLTGFEPFTQKKQGAPRGNTNGADGAKFKRETLARLLRMRKDGLTIAKIVNVSNGSIKEETVLDILGAKRVPIAAYRLLAAVLDKIEES